LADVAKAPAEFAETKTAAASDPPEAVEPLADAAGELAVVG
jgi:hypothetical protein